MDSRALQAQLDDVEALDPFSHGATPKLRADRTIAAFHIAVERLAACGVPVAPAAGSSGKAANAKQPEQSSSPKQPQPWSGFAKWAEQLSPMMSERKLRGRDDVIENTMRFAFQVETAAQKDCGKLTANDEALLLLARERMGATDEPTT